MIRNGSGKMKGRRNHRRDTSTGMIDGLIVKMQRDSMGEVNWKRYGRARAHMHPMEFSLLSGFLAMGARVVHL